MYGTKRCYEAKSTGFQVHRLLRVLSTDYPEDEEGSLIQDKSTLRRVSVCDGWREVQTILDEYRETAFSDLVYMIRICAKIPPTETHYNRVDRIIIRAFKNNESRHEHPRQLTEWILQQICG